MEIKIKEKNEIRTIEVPDGKAVSLTFEINCPNLQEISSGAEFIHIGNTSD